MMARKKPDDRQQLWDEILDTSVKAAHKRVHRDAEWYLRALRLVREAEEKLLDGLTDTVTAWRLADELRNGNDADD